ncbi:MAG: hypothetical protein KGI69_01140 [Patescibacteria group bacterium]|nr:hypothetical protein [Patescibacteria group bacterium]
MYGVFGILIGLATHQLMIFSISLGLFVDELTYLIIGGTSHRDNYSPISILGTIAFIVAVFFLRDYLVAPFTHL